MLNTLNLNINKIFLLSDLHFGVRGNSFEWLENQLNFFYNFYIPFIKKNIESNDILLIIGDWFDNRQSIDIFVINKCQELINELSKIIPIYFMPGNHDNYKRNESNVNSLVVFKNINNVYLIDKPTVIHNGSKKYLILPWVGENDSEQKYLKTKYDIVFGHFNMIGFKMDNGMPITSGVDVSGVKNFVISGHIHKRQSNNKLVYLGSPYHLKRSDIDNQKGCYIFKTKDETLDFFKNDYSPIFQRIHIDFILDNNIETIKKIFDNNYTDIILTNEYVNKFNLSRFIDILDNNKCKYKKIEIVIKDVKVDTLFFMNNNVSENKDIKTIIEESINDMDLELEFKTKLKNINNNYYKQMETD